MGSRGFWNVVHIRSLEWMVVSYKVGAVACVVYCRSTAGAGVPKCRSDGSKVVDDLPRVRSVLKWCRPVLADLTHFSLTEDGLNDRKRVKNHWRIWSVKFWRTFVFKHFVWSERVLNDVHQQQKWKINEHIQWRVNGTEQLAWHCALHSHTLARYICLHICRFRAPHNKHNRISRNQTNTHTSQNIILFGGGDGGDGGRATRKTEKTNGDHALLM